MAERLKPPYGYTTWLEVCLSHAPDGYAHQPYDYALEELEELRAEVKELRVRNLSPACKTCSAAMGLDCPSCKKLWESVGLSESEPGRDKGRRT